MSTVNALPPEETKQAARVKRGASQTLTSRALRRFVRQRASMVAVGFIALLVVIALIPGVLSPFDPNAIDLRNTFALPSWTHPLGTDNTGRDLLSRMLWGTRTSLLAALIATSLAILVGFVIGVVSGYVGGWVDYLLMRVCDALISIPGLLMAIAIVGVLGPGLFNAMLGLAVVFSPTFARLVRSQVLEVKEETYVTAARGLGFGSFRILGSHVIPNILSPLFVQAFIVFGSAILAEGALSFLGYSVQPPDPSWGNIILRAFEDIYIQGWQILVPGAVITLTVWSLNVIGDGLRDSFDIK